jgi:hypothetical protein
MRTILFLFLLTTSISFAQVGIGTTNPNPDALLDLTTTDQGLLLPRVILTDSTSAAPLTAHVAGMFVYNTTTSGNVSQGVYYNDGISWRRLNSAARGWLLNGNTGTNSATNFLGTTDNQALTIRTNDIEKVRVETNGTISTLNTGRSVFIGEGAGANDDLTDNINTFVGYNSGMSNTDGLRNTALGVNTLSSNISGRNNTAIGGLALTSNISGDSNIAVGAFSLSNNTDGRNNIGLGNQSLRSNIFGEGNVAIGDYAGRVLDFGNAVDIDNNFNVFVGSGAGNSDRNSSRNVYIGYDAGAGDYDLTGNTGTLEDKVGNVFIGNEAGYDESGSNKLYIENTANDADNALIYGEFDNNILRTNSEFQIGNPATTGFAFPTTDGTANQILVTDGSGAVSWQNANTSTLSLVRARMTSAQTLVSGSQKLLFDTTDFDINSEFDTVNNQFVAGSDGFYNFSAQFSTDAQTNTTTYTLVIYINGAIYQRVEQNHSGSGRITRQISAIAQLSATDIVHIEVITTGTGAGTSVLNNNTRTCFNIERIR